MTVDGGQFGTMRYVTFSSETIMSNITATNINGNGLDLWDNAGFVIATDILIQCVPLSNGTALTIDGTSE